MDSRIALRNNTQLRFHNKEGGAILYTIVKEIGRGGSCIVYDAAYETNTGDTKRVRIKECYPSKLQIIRDTDNHLHPVPADADAFDGEKEKFRADFSLGNGLFYAEGLFDALTNTIDIYDGNGTTYLVSVYSLECTLATYKPNDIKTCITLTKQVSHILKRIHSEGYVYLDIKPENVLVSDSYTTRVQLFDFDSLIPMAMIQNPSSLDLGNIRLSYSKGFAAIELQTAKLRKLGPHTDVYGVGALLFYLLFGVTPTASDCEPNATFDYGKMLYSTEYQDKLFFALSEFFHNSLANFYLDRFHDMQQVIDHLADIEELTDSAAAYIRSTKISSPPLLVGRSDEIQQLYQWYKSSKTQCLIVSGMGGIGKSTIVRAFLSNYRQHFDNLLYLPFKNTLLQTLSDDYTASISTTTKDSNESSVDYYRRKLTAFKNIVSGTNSLLVIDNYSGGIDSDLLDVLQVGWKVILISRQIPPAGEYDVLPITAIHDKEALYCLFEQNLRRELAEEEKPFIDNIIQKTAAHTLVIDLIAKQLSASYIDIAIASDLVDEFGFAEIAPEKVSVQKDAVTTYQTIGAFITALFEADQLSDSKINILKAISLLDVDGININLLHNLIGTIVKDNANELITNGWLQIDGKDVSMHPVIKETVHRWKWTDAALSTSLLLISNLGKQLNHYNHPSLSENSKPAQKLPFVEKWGTRISEANTKPVSEQRFAHIGNNPQKTLETYLFLRIAEGIIDSCEREPEISSSQEHTDLLYYTVINMPRYREDFILGHSLNLIRQHSNSNGVALMKLYHGALSVYQERKAFDEANSLLQTAKSTASLCGDNYVYALYYDLLSEFYDHVLSGAYDAVTPDEKILFQKMQNTIDKAIRYAKKVDGNNATELLTKNLLAKVTLIIRNSPNRKKKIDRILNEAKFLIDKYASLTAEIRSMYYMVCAWYHTLVTRSFETAIEFIEQARGITKETAETDLDFIDNWVVPSADILCQWGEYELSANLLSSATEICERKKDVVPYIRKNLELRKYQLDVYCEWGEMDLAHKTLEDLDDLNLLYTSIGITVDIPAALRDYLA